MHFYDAYKHSNDFPILDAAFLICDLSPPPADRIYPSEWLQTHEAADVARAQSVVAQLMEWVWESRKESRAWSMDDACKHTLGRDDLLAWCSYCDLKPQFLTPPDNLPTLMQRMDSEPTPKTKASYLKTILALAAYVTDDKDIAQHRKTAEAIISALASKGIEAPVTAETLGKYLAEARDIA